MSNDNEKRRPGFTRRQFNAALAASGTLAALSPFGIARAQATKLKEKHSAKKVDYEIVLRDGKTLIKPIVR